MQLLSKKRIEDCMTALSEQAQRLLANRRKRQLPRRTIT
jgi:hypothetical protein